MKNDPDKLFASFMKQMRGDQTYAAFSRKTGLTPSTLFRLENGQQSITLKRLGQVLTRLKKKPSDVFGEQECTVRR